MLCGTRRSDDVASEPTTCTEHRDAHALRSAANSGKRSFDPPPSDTRSSRSGAQQTGFVEALAKRSSHRRVRTWGRAIQEPIHGHHGLLRLRRERPHGCRGTNQSREYGSTEPLFIHRTRWVSATPTSPVRSKYDCRLWH